jgi:iron-sulfur cluster insertion protein
METIVSFPDYRSAQAPLVFTDAAARKVHELIQ